MNSIKCTVCGSLTVPCRCVTATEEACKPVYRPMFDEAKPIKTYTQAELDERIKEACERQREICFDSLKTKTIEIGMAQGLYMWQEKAIKYAPLAGEEK